MSEVKCSYCELNLEDETLYICEDCNEVFCEDCKSKHQCRFEPEEHKNESCCECGEVAEDLWECAGNYYCDDCKEDREKSERERMSFEEMDYADYIKDKIIDDLSEK